MSSKIETVTIHKDTNIEGYGIFYAGTYRVDMPSDYDPALIGADDIVQDGSLTLVGDGVPTEDASNDLTRTTVKSSGRLSNSAMHRLGGKGSGRARWWLRASDGSYVSLSGNLRGDEPFSQELDLAPGEYVLGVGDVSGRNSGVRDRFVVVARGTST